MDWGYISFLMLSTVLGVVRGFVHMVMALVGWVIAFFASRHFADTVSVYLAPIDLEDISRYAVAFVLIFIVTLLVLDVLTMLLKRFINSTGLGYLDHFLGGMLGLTRGIILVILFTVFMSLTPTNEADAWNNFISVKLSKLAAHHLQSILPPSISKFLP